MNFRYNPITRYAKILYRKFNPVPRSPWRAEDLDGKVDVCEVNLVPPTKLIEFFSGCIDTLRSIKGEDIGDYLEFGVFNGNSIGSMYIACDKKGAKSTRLFGFDAFEGLPAGAENEDGGVWKKGFYSCSFEQMKECLTRRNVNTESITWVKGWYDQTLTSETAQKYGIKNVGIVFIDCDTYSSSKIVLDFLGSILTKPVILCFDDWKLNDLDVKGMGEYKSFNEFLDTHQHWDVKEIKSYNRKSKSFLVQPK
jgi:hypothetical protein